MTYQSFTATSFANFAMKQGSILSPGKQELALVPLELLSCCTPDGNTRRESAKWGRQQASQLAGQLEADSNEIDMDALAQHLSTTVALMGLGQIEISIRNNALTFIIKKDGDTSFNMPLSLVLEGFLGGFLSALAGKEFDTVTVTRDSKQLLMFAGNPEAVSRVSQQLDNGTPAFEAIDSLATGGSL